MVARPEPENSLLEIVAGFSRKLRGFKLVVLGDYEPDKNMYHRAVLAAAGQEVMFVGSIYDNAVVSALRFHSVAYMHGHQVGGTNPSLVEAMGAGNPVIANDNHFNRWVAGDSAKFFGCADGCSALLDEVLENPEVLAQMKAGVMQRHQDSFSWEGVLAEYETLLEKWLPNRKAN